MDIRAVFDISAAPIAVGSTDFTIPLESLPRLLPDGRVWVGPVRTGHLRCRMEDGPVMNRGSYGIIQKAMRTDPTGHRTPAIVIKRPKKPTESFGPEALLQRVAGDTLERVGAAGSVAKVRDIYQFAGEVRFSMDYINGCSALTYCLKQEPDEPAGRAFQQVLAQVCFLLLVLEREINFDHRDLKADNLWIREGTPVAYSYRVDSQLYEVSAPFQVVLLDFGYACLGSAEEKRAIVNLGDGVFPLLDPCPKEGRDMFQLLHSFWSVQPLRSRLPTAMQAEMGGFLVPPAAAPSFTWTYAVVAAAEFKIPCLTPARLLEKLGCLRV